MSRLTEQRVGEIFDAVLALVVEHGYDNVTMDQIATATRSSKATLYRQWKSKEGIVVEALQTHLPHHPEQTPDTGTLRGDLAVLSGEAVASGEQLENDLTAAILHAVKSNPELGLTLRDRVLARYTTVFGSVIARAQARGEVPADAPALRFGAVVLIAPFLLCGLIEGHEITEDYLLDYLDSVLVPLLTAGATSR